MPWFGGTKAGAILYLEEKIKEQINKLSETGSGAIF